MSRDQPTFEDVRKCGRCDTERHTKIIEARLINGILIRRRECRACDYIRTTYEVDSNDFWGQLRLRNYKALSIAADYIGREADRLKGIPPESTEKLFRQ